MPDQPLLNGIIVNITSDKYFKNISMTIEVIRADAEKEVIPSESFSKTINVIRHICSKAFVNPYGAEHLSSEAASRIYSKPAHIEDGILKLSENHNNWLTEQDRKDLVMFNKLNAKFIASFIHCGGQSYARNNKLLIDIPTKAGFRVLQLSIPDYWPYEAFEIFESIIDKLKDIHMDVLGLRVS